MPAMPSGAWAAARTAADRIVGRHAHDSVVKGVLAQWIAENGWRWPPPRNNPGNLARGWAANFGYPFYIVTPNPQPSNPIVSFRRLTDGAECYAAGLVRFARYSSAVAAARANEGLTFAVRVCQAGYGTRESTVRSVYAQLGGVIVQPPPQLPGGHDAMIRYAQVSGTRTRMTLQKGQVLSAYPGGPRVTTVQESGSFPHVGWVNVAGTHDWRAVLVGTRAPYDDGVKRPTVLYVPASAGKVVPT
jgi:hypothetical protein